jgi:hypothetical protein
MEPAAPGPRTGPPSWPSAPFGRQLPPPGAACRPTQRDRWQRRRDQLFGLGGLFVAHVTGNLAILVAHLVTRNQIGVGLLLSVPAVVLVLALARLLAAGLDAVGVASLRPLLLQLLLLAGFLALGGRRRPARQPECGHRGRGRHAGGGRHGGPERAGPAVAGGGAPTAVNDQQPHPLHHGRRRGRAGARPRGGGPGPASHSRHLAGHRWLCRRRRARGGVLCDRWVPVGLALLALPQPGTSS